MASVSLLAAGIVGVWYPADVGEFAVVVTFVAVPSVAGVIGGWRRFGMPSAIVNGIAPPAAAFVVIPIGDAIGVGTLGGGDLPTIVFSVMMILPSLGAALIGFGIGTILGVFGRIK